MQTDTSILANNSLHCWMLRVASICTPCCMLLRVVKGVVVQNLKPVDLLATCKRTQQRPTLLGQQWWELLHPFARSFDAVGLSLTTSGFCLFSFFVVRNFPYLSILANCLILSLDFHFRKQERIILFFVRDIQWLLITAINLVSADISPVIPRLLLIPNTEFPRNKRLTGETH